LAGRRVTDLFQALLPHVHRQETRPPHDARPAEAVDHAHEIGIFKLQFDLIVTGRKTTKIRVNDSSRRKIKEGSHPVPLPGRRIPHPSHPHRPLRDLRRMFASETLASVSSLATREEQLANPPDLSPEREALGVAICIELVAPATRRVRGFLGRHR
jgi:ASC-1-like (ASCH) protein